MISKRKFLKLGIGGTAGIFLAPFLKPTSLFGRSCELPQTYLQSSIHGHWMKLSYNNGGESRETRRRLELALRNLGAVRGMGLGFSFTSFFDQAVEAEFGHWRKTAQKPGSVFQLLQAMYDNYIFPQIGVPGGQILFGTLFALLRGQDGTALGAQAHQAYVDYRAAALAHKNAYKTTQDPIVIEQIRKQRHALLLNWQKSLKDLGGLYATRQMSLNPNFKVQIEMLEGFEEEMVPVALMPPHLNIYLWPPNHRSVLVSWKGGAKLQQGPSLNGPWTDTHKSSPATFDGMPPRLFFRTVQ